MRKLRPNYTFDEVDALVDYYCERRSFTTKLTWLVRYCDLETALSKMPPKDYEAVLLVGLIALPLRYAAKQSGLTKDQMWKRYNRGIEWITTYLNEGGKSYKQKNS